MKIFVSSTIDDLGPDRGLVRSELSGMSAEPFCSEYEGAKWLTVEKTIRERIDSCDIFIGIYGARYGYIPKPSTPSRLWDGEVSVTHSEFKRARELRKPTLIYIKNQLPRDELQNAFLSEIEDFFGGYYVSYYDSPEDLGGRIKADLVALLTSLIRGEYRYPAHHLPTLVVCETREGLFRYVAERVEEVLASGQRPTIGLFAGRTAGAVYDSVVNRWSGKAVKGLRNARFYMNAEHFALSKDHPNTYKTFLVENFFKPLETVAGLDLAEKLVAIPSNIPAGVLDNILRDYDTKVGAARIHLQLLGVGPNGQIASVDPSNLTIEALELQTTALVELGRISYEYLFPQPATRFGITMGIGNILRCSESILLVASGSDKANAIKQLLVGPISPSNPATLLKKHRDLTVACDKEALSSLPGAWVERYPRIRPYS